MINAMSNSVVPNISINMGGSFGAAYYAMCGRGYQPRFFFSWPNANCHVMGPDQLSGVMELLGREKAERSGKAADEAKLGMIKSMLKGKITEEMSAFHYSTHVIDDGIIDPRDTRQVLGMALSACCNTKINKGFVQGLSRL